MWAIKLIGNYNTVINAFIVKHVRIQEVYLIQNEEEDRNEQERVPGGNASVLSPGDCIEFA